MDSLLKCHQDKPQVSWWSIVLLCSFHTHTPLKVGTLFFFHFWFWPLVFEVFFPWHVLEWLSYSCKFPPSSKHFENLMFWIIFGFLALFEKIPSRRNSPVSLKTRWRLLYIVNQRFWSSVEFYMDWISLKKNRPVGFSDFHLAYLVECINAQWYDFWGKY